MLGNHKKTERGFAFVEFTDANGKECSLQQSSAIGDDDDAVDRPGSSFVWLGVDDEKRMHLNREQVKGLVKRLQQWLKTGKLEAR
jgi:hypothetical protein